MFGVRGKKYQQEQLHQRKLELDGVIDMVIDDFRESIRLYEDQVLESGASDSCLTHEARYPISRELDEGELSHMAVCFELEAISASDSWDEYPKAPFLETVLIDQQQLNLCIKLTARRQIVQWQEALG